MVRALRELPDEADRERWLEEFRQLLSEHEGRPYKQYRESKELIRAAKGLGRVYAPPEKKSADLAEKGVTSLEGELEEAAAGATPRLPDKQALKEALEHLSYRERRVLELRYGLDGKGQRTLDEIGRAFNVRSERIGQIEGQCLKKLQQLIEAQKLREIK